MIETPSPTARDSRPIPDPTVLTTQQLNREIATVREIIETRLNAMDLANRLHREANERTPDLIKSEIKAIADLSNEKFRSVQIKFDEREEKFRSIQTQFLERDTRSEQSSRDGKIAIDAALQAAKEAVGEQNKSSALAIAKSEAATTKQIDQIIVLINTTTGHHDEIAERQDRRHQKPADADRGPLQRLGRPVGLCRRRDRPGGRHGHPGGRLHQVFLQ